MNLTELETKLAAIDAETTQNLNNVPTTIEVETIPAEVVPAEPVSEVVPSEHVSEVVTTIETETIPAEPNIEKDGTPLVSAERLIPGNDIVDMEVVTQPIAEQPIETPAPTPQPVSIPVPRTTEVRTVSLTFPQGNFSKGEVAKHNNIEYVTASGLVNFLENQGVVKQAGKLQGLGRGKPTVLYSF